MTNPKRDEPVATITHRESGEEWALSTDRVPVFSVLRAPRALLRAPRSACRQCWSIW